MRRSISYKINPKNEDKLLILGFDCVRFGGDSLTSSLADGFDTKRAEQPIKSVIDSGVNYFDTAYVYNGSKEVFSKILAEYGVCDEVYMATKMPLILCRSRNDSDEYFAKHLERLQTDHIDYYLLYMLVDMKTWSTLCEWRIKGWVAEKKASGQMRQFSLLFHGAQDELMVLLDAYDRDFCQVQYNYSDESYQAGVKGLKRAVVRGMPMMIMEPLLGGKLAGSLPKAAVELLKAMWSGIRFSVRKK